jgi:hypothetical protein
MRREKAAYRGSDHPIIAKIKAGEKMNFTPEEIEVRKKAIFDSMSPRAQKRILKLGYERWDPFEAPKDPIDIRRDKSNRTSQMLVREFLQSLPLESYSNSYGRGVLEMAVGIINDDDRFIGMYEFAIWHQALLRNEGVLVSDNDENGNPQ